MAVYRRYKDRYPPVPAAAEEEEPSLTLTEDDEDEEAALTPEQRETVCRALRDMINARIGSGTCVRVLDYSTNGDGDIVYVSYRYNSGMDGDSDRDIPVSAGSDEWPLVGTPNERDTLEGAAEEGSADSDDAEPVEVPLSPDQEMGIVVSGLQRDFPESCANIQSYTIDGNGRFTSIVVIVDGNPVTILAGQRGWPNEFDRNHYTHTQLLEWYGSEDAQLIAGYESDGEPIYTIIAEPDGGADDVVPLMLPWEEHILPEEAPAPAPAAAPAAPLPPAVVLSPEQLGVRGKGQMPSYGGGNGWAGTTYPIRRTAEETRHQFNTRHGAGTLGSSMMQHVTTDRSEGGAFGDRSNPKPPTGNGEQSESAATAEENADTVTKQEKATTDAAAAKSKEKAEKKDKSELKRDSLPEAATEQEQMQRRD